MTTRKTNRINVLISEEKKQKLRIKVAEDNTTITEFIIKKVDEYLKENKK